MGIKHPLANTPCDDLRERWFSGNTWLDREMTLRFAAGSEVGVWFEATGLVSKIKTPIQRVVALWDVALREIDPSSGKQVSPYPIHPNRARYQIWPVAPHKASATDAAGCPYLIGDFLYLVCAKPIVIQSETGALFFVDIQRVQRGRHADSSYVGLPPDIIERIKTATIFVLPPLKPRMLYDATFTMNDWRKSMRRKMTGLLGWDSLKQFTVSARLCGECVAHAFHQEYQLRDLTESLSEHEGFCGFCRQCEKAKRPSLMLPFLDPSRFLNFYKFLKSLRPWRELEVQRISSPSA